MDGPAGLAQGHDAVMPVDRGRKLPEGVKPARRITPAMEAGISDHVWKLEEIADLAS